MKNAISYIIVAIIFTIAGFATDHFAFNNSHDANIDAAIAGFRSSIDADYAERIQYIAKIESIIKPSIAVNEKLSESIRASQERSRNIGASISNAIKSGTDAITVLESVIAIIDGFLRQ